MMESKDKSCATKYFQPDRIVLAYFNPLDHNFKHSFKMQRGTINLVYRSKLFALIFLGQVRYTTFVL